MPFCQNCGTMQYPGKPCRNLKCKKAAPEAAAIDEIIGSYLQARPISGFLRDTAASKNKSLQEITEEFRRILQEKDLHFINVTGATEYKSEYVVSGVSGQHKKPSARPCPHKALMHFNYFLDLEKKKRRGADYVVIAGSSTAICEEPACLHPYAIRFSVLHNIRIDELRLRKSNYDALLKSRLATRSVFERFIVHVPKQ